MPKLNQIIAIQAGKKSQAKDSLTAAYHQLKKPELLSGLTRTYQPRDETGEPQPDERKQVQLKVGDLILSFDGKEASDRNALTAAVRLAGSKVKVVIQREGGRLELDAELDPTDKPKGDGPKRRWF